MNFTARAKNLLSQPSYRLRLAFFFLLGAVLFLAGLLIGNDFWKETLLQLALVFIGVGLVEIAWDILGGDPVEMQLERRFGDLGLRMDAMHRSLNVLADINRHNLGIERIWPTRRIWENDPADGLIPSKERLCAAKSVDIVSNTLWTNWMQDNEFRRRLFESIAGGLKARILVYHPGALILRLRAANEFDPKGQMQNEITSALEIIARERQRLSEAQRANLQVRLTTSFYHLFQIVRYDEAILLATYLSGRAGSSSPTYLLRGPESVAFRTYKDQVNILWEAASELDEASFASLLAQKGLELAPENDPMLQTLQR